MSDRSDRERDAVAEAVGLLEHVRRVQEQREPWWIRHVEGLSQTLFWLSGFFAGLYVAAPLLHR